MRILVSEYLCWGAVGHLPGSESLRREGLAMFRAIVEDLARCSGVELLAPLHPSLLANRNLSWPANLHAVAVNGRQDEFVFDRLARECAAALVIAPECNDLLWQQCRKFEAWGVPLLGPGSESVRLTGDKWRLAQLWQDAGVATPVCFSLFSIENDGARAEHYPCVLKPRHGAGSQATFRVRDPAELQRDLERAQVEVPGGEFLLQRFVPGRPASVAFLEGPRGRVTLPAVWQHLSGDGRFRYQGGQLPLPADLNRRAQRLAAHSIQAVPGLHGCFGVDLILGEAEDGGEDQAIEINPRLTTSYVGLRALADFNLAETLLALQGLVETMPKERWGAHTVTFRADGMASGGRQPPDSRSPQHPPESGG
jgi:tyramine---L-glutamate ligase